MRKSYRKRRVEEPPSINHFKPAGIPARQLDTIYLSVDEYEAIRLADYRQMEHLASSQNMDISRPTFTRLIERARYKVACALIEGKELVIHGGNIDFEQTLQQCDTCGEKNKIMARELLDQCPECGSEEITDLSQKFLQPQRGKESRGNKK